MSLRLIEIFLSDAHSQQLNAIADNEAVVGSWRTQIEGEQQLIRVLVRAEDAERMCDDLQNRFSGVDNCRLIILPVEATLPRLSDPIADEATEAHQKSPERISREELYAELATSASLTRVFIASTVIATLVAAVGLMRDDTAIIIGAMVIAPLLGPNMSLCLATALGDMELAKKSLRTNATGLLVALLVSLLAGTLLPLDPSSESVLSRTNVNMGDVVLALASGSAGVLAFTTGAPASLIGVMVAVALLPPFAVFGLMLATGEFDLARGALMLVATNVICVNLAGVLTFVAQGIRPRTWWEAERATKATRISVAIWFILLLALVLLIIQSSGWSL
ncbi:MAG: TIGR00341 family protein [Pirellulaceae bacterium]|nr:TIGR00341 family protein [Pirellulaceae bacterium]